MYVTPTLYFSEDDLTVSNASASYVDVTAYLLEATWSSGVQREGDDPQPGQARFVLDDRTRRFEPDYAAGTYYPNIVPERRFKLTVSTASGTAAEGVWFSSKWQPSWPDRLMMQVTTVECADGFLPLALDNLPLLDPPDAQSYPDVVNFDEPWGYWRLGDPAGTRAVAQVRRVVRGKGKNRRVRTRNQRIVTASPAEGVSGPAGTYKNTPSLGQDSLILGDPDKGVAFTDDTEHMVAVVEEQTTFSDANAVTAEIWVEPIDTDSGGLIVGPFTNGTNMFGIGITAGPVYNAFVELPAGQLPVSSTSAPTVGQIDYVAITWDGHTLILYVNGVEEDRAGGSGGLESASANPRVYVAYVGASCHFVGDEAAMYERALSPARILAHYTAGSARGFPQQTAGERIAAIVASNLWAETEIQTTGRDVIPQMMFGQSRLEEIAELAHAEGPRTLFFYNPDGNPTYLGHEWKATDAAYNTVQATFGNQAGEVPYDDIDLDYDDEFYRNVVASREGGGLVEASEGVGPDRVNDDYTDLLLTDDTYVESLAEHVLELYKTPAFRPVALHLTGEDSATRNHILLRQIGDLIRIKHRPKGGTAIDRVAHIIGWEKRLEAETGRLTATWYLGRGFDGSSTYWRAGIHGRSEAGSTTKAA